MFIMVVEDDAIVGLGISFTVRDMGHTAVGPIRSNADAFAELEKNASIDLAVLDFQLKDGNALALARYLSSRSIPYFWCSAQRPLHVEDEVPVLMKPFLVSEFRQTIDVLLQATIRRSTPE